MVRIQGWVGKGEHGTGVVQDTADEVASDIGKPGVASLIVEERLAILPQGHVGVHTRTIIAGQRLRHEGRRLSPFLGGAFDHILEGLNVIAGVQQGLKR